jgi:cell wall-associated NlpC family hydrolase
MFGLMRANSCIEHSSQQWRAWRNQYCGTCKTIGARYGQRARIVLNHDTVFLAELLNALGDPVSWNSAYRSFNCLSMPSRIEEMPATLRYAAAATLTLAEFKVADHVEDTGRPRWRLAARAFRRPFERAQTDLSALGFPLPRLETVLAQQQDREQTGETLEDFAYPTAAATALFFEHGATVAGLGPHLAPVLANLGRSFGALAYLLDAFQDFERDRATGSFNAIAASGQTQRSSAIPKIEALVESFCHNLADVPLAPGDAAGFASRLRSNVQRQLGRRLPVCVPLEPRVSISARWSASWEFARRISAGRASFTVAVVAVVAFLVPSHSRAAATPGECLSLGFNLMALSSVFAMAVTARAKDPKSKKSCGCCDWIDGDCCDCADCGGCCECCGGGCDC